MDHAHDGGPVVVTMTIVAIAAGTVAFFLGLAIGVMR